jgi:hypothetical protein
MEYKYEELDKEQQEQRFDPSEKEVEVVQRVYSRYLTMKQERDKVRREFDGRNLTQYVNDSVDAYNGIVSDEIKSTKDDWQSLIWDHKTRGKVKTVIAMIVGARPFISMVGKSRSANEYASDMLNVYEDTWKQEKGSYKLFLQALSACVKGTVIVEEMYVEEKVKRKEIKSVDQETGLVEYEEKEVIKNGAGRVECKIVPLLQFFPNENSSEIEHDCIVLKQYTRKAFMNKYGKYPNAEYVRKGNLYFDPSEAKYKEQPINENELIDVVSYYNEDWDEHIILANNIWLNKQKNDSIAPIPFDHKRLPFSKTVFELADEDVFYGKSLPDLMRGEQDPTNALERLMVDREILSLNRGFILGAGVEIDSYELYPGSVKKVTGGNPNIPINQQILEQDVMGANQSGFQMLQLLKNNADTNTSIDATAQGVHSGRKTARETVILDENSKRNSGPFQIHIYKLLWDRAEMRVENIKQFYTSPLQVTVLKDKTGEPVLGDDGKPIPNGKQYREITVTKPGKNPTWFSINPKIKGCEFEIRFVEDYEMPQNQSARMELAKARLDEAKVNPLLNADECTIDYLETMRSNPDRFYIKPKPADIQFQNEQGIPPMNPGSQPMPNEIPGSQVVDNKKILAGVRK